MLDGNQNIKVAKLKFKARSMTLDLKMQKKWRYEDTTCIGCGVNNETGEEILSCSGYSDSKDDFWEQSVMYSIFYCEKQVRWPNLQRCYFYLHAFKKLEINQTKK